MENVPLTTESEKKSRKRKAGDLGAVAAHTRRNSESAVERAERRWQRPPKPESSDKPTTDNHAEKLTPITHLSPEAVPESQAPTEELGEQETPFVVRKLAKFRKKQVSAEPTDGTVATIGPKAAVELYYDAVDEDGDPEQSYEDVMNILGVKPEEEPLHKGGEEIADTFEVKPEGETSEASNEFIDVFDRHATETADSGEEEVADDPPKGGGHGGGSGRPPAVPISSFSGPSGPGTPPPPRGPGGGPVGGPGGFGGPSFSPHLAPLPTPDIAPRAPEYDVGNPAAAALLGGIIGYLIGRRRGRIKTEKRLLPVQKKLEKQVTGLQWQLQEKETKIRRAATEQIQAQGALIAERINQAAAERQARRQQERLVQRRPAPEANQLHSTNRRQEQIGHILVAAETPLAERQSSAIPEASRPVPRSLERTTEKSTEILSKAGVETRAETLNRAELLSLSERIIVDGSSLRQIYESHLLGERGLRRLVSEHLRGGDLKKALRLEIVEREIDFERDPAMRDLPHQVSKANGGGTTALNDLLQKAAVNLPGGSEETAFLKARAHYEAAQQSQHQMQRRVIDISLATAIIILISAVIILYLRGA